MFDRLGSGNSCHIWPRIYYLIDNLPQAYSGIRAWGGGIDGNNGEVVFITPKNPLK